MKNIILIDAHMDDRNRIIDYIYQNNIKLSKIISEYAIRTNIVRFITEMTEEECIMMKLKFNISLTK